MMAVVLPLWALELNALPLFIGIIISSRQILAVTLLIHSGTLMDRLGPRRVIMVLGLIGAALLLAYPALPFIWVLVCLQIVSGFIETANWIGAQTLVGRLLKGQAVHAGRMTAAARSGGFIGPWLAGLAWQFQGPEGAFGMVALWVSMSVIMAFMLPDTGLAAPATETGPPPGNEPGDSKLRAADVMPKLSDYKAAFRLLVIPAVALVIAATTVRQTGSGMQNAFYGVWLKEIGYTAGTIGFLIGLGNAVSAGAALSIGPLTRRMASHWLLLITVAVSIAAIAVTPLLEGLVVLMVAISLRGVGQGLNLPLMMSLAARSVGLDLQGRVAALRISFNRLGSLLVPIAMGAIAELIGLERAFYAMGGAGIVLIALLALWVSRLRLDP